MEGTNESTELRRHPYCWQTVGNENEKKEIWNGLLVKGSKGAVVVAEWSLPTQEVFGSNPCIGKLNILLSTVLKRPK